MLAVHCCAFCVFSRLCWFVSCIKYSLVAAHSFRYPHFTLYSSRVVNLRAEINRLTAVLSSSETEISMVRKAHTVVNAVCTVSRQRSDVFDYHYCVVVGDVVDNYCDVVVEDI